jgi:hypothetical protein
MWASCAIRGSFLDFVDDPWKHPGHEDRAARFVGDGLLVVRDESRVAELLEHPDKLAVTVAAFAAAENAINSPAATERSEAFKAKSTSPSRVESHGPWLQRTKTEFRRKSCRS